MKKFYMLVGMKHLDAEALVRRTRNGAALTLERDLLNDHDCNAVCVRIGERRVGYVQATEARDLARMMDSAKKMTAPATLIKDRKWPRIEVDTDAITGA